MFNKIKKNKEIFNWIYPRIYVLLALFVDSSLFLIFIVKSTDDISLTNINTFLILISWIIISYIFGRYSDYNNNNLINLSNQSFKLIILYFFLNLVKGIFFIFYTIDNQLLIFRNFNLFYLYYASISLIGLMTINSMGSGLNRSTLNQCVNNNDNSACEYLLTKGSKFQQAEARKVLLIRGL